MRRWSIEGRSKREIFLQELNGLKYVECRKALAKRFRSLVSPCGKIEQVSIKSHQVGGLSGDREFQKLGIFWVAAESECPADINYISEVQQSLEDRINMSRGEPWKALLNVRAEDYEPVFRENFAAQQDDCLTVLTSGQNFR